jgi:hypothetical protein
MRGEVFGDNVHNHQPSGEPIGRSLPDTHSALHDARPSANHARDLHFSVDYREKVRVRQTGAGLYPRRASTIESASHVRPLPTIIVEGEAFIDQRAAEGGYLPIPYLGVVSLFDGVRGEA